MKQSVYAISLTVIKRATSFLTIVACALAAFTQSGCVHVKVDPVRIDATVTIRVERELENFFNDLDSQSSTFVLEKDSETPQSDKSPNSGGAL